MRGGRGIFPSLRSIAWNLSATKIGSKFFSKEVRGGQGDGGTGRKWCLIPLSTRSISNSLWIIRWWIQQKNDAFVCFYITLIPCRGKYSILVRGTTDWNCPPWLGTIVPLAWVTLQQEILVRNVELTSYCPPEKFGKGQKERGNARQHALPTSQIPSCWNPSWLSDAQATRKDPEPEWPKTNQKLTLLA